jgi:hypothetical protein
MIETTQQYNEAKIALASLKGDIDERRALLKVRTKAYRELNKEILKWNMRKAVEKK